MSDLWVLPLPMADKIVRAAVGYLFLLIAFRVLGRRQLGQLTNFDLVVVLVVANVLQNAMIGDDNSLAGGLIGAVTVLGLNALVAAGVYRSRGLERLVDGDPLVIARDGRLVRTRVRREFITENDVMAAARASGIEHLRDVRLAILESNGGISVFGEPARTDSTKASAGPATPPRSL